LAAVAIAIRPEEHWRSMVIAGTVTGKAGAQRGEAGDVAAGRTLLHGGAHHDIVDFAAFQPGAFDGGAIEKAPSAPPWSAGVRAVETMTASRMGEFLIL
jgi:hypothetical protein